MKIFGDNPGVEWAPDALDPEQTVPVAAEPVRAVFVDPYPPACAECGGDLGVDGYCMTCGAKAKTLREHYEMSPSTWVAGVCDIGRTHARNEDALDCKSDAGRAILVVCDGVTTAPDSDLASMTAARLTCDVLWAIHPQGMGMPESRTAAMRTAITDVVSKANDAIISTITQDEQSSTASTIAIGIVDESEIYAANLGDSRVYWLPDDSAPTQLTKDHSLAQADMDAGKGRAQAESSTLAHTITKWLGADSRDVTPNITNMTITESGWLIVCSDGLWNYVSEATALARLVAQTGAQTPADLAVKLVAWANDQGGHDNITVACARVTCPTTADKSSEEPVAEEHVDSQENPSQGDPASATQSDQSSGSTIETAPVSQ